MPAAAEPRLPRAGARLAEVEDIEVEVEKLVAGGEGLARFEGIPIFVPRSAPGDRLRVRLVERRPDFGRGETLEILRPGPDRRPAPCPHFANCGGCDLQHLNDEAQTRLKAQAVLETLERLGRVQRPADFRIVVGSPWAYRLRAQLHTSEIGGLGGAVRVGYHARGSNELVAIGQCPVLTPALEGLVKELPAALRTAFPEAGSVPRRVDLAAGQDGALSTAPVVEGLPHGEVTFAAGEFVYAFDARCFFQAHSGLLNELVEVAVGSWKGEAAYDLFSGVGLFTLPLARRYGRVTGVESDAGAVRFARTNARRNRILNAEFVQRPLDAWIRELPRDVDRVLIDPPREGLSMPARRVLLHRRPRRLTYVSCHAATLARDLRELQESYTVESLALLDLFPQTGHMEAVVQLAAIAGAP